MRDLNKVMDAVLNQVPKDHPSHGPLSRSMDKIRESIPYTAPEAIHIRWQTLAETLMFMYQNLDTEWTRRIRKIMAAELDYKDYL